MYDSTDVEVLTQSACLRLLRETVFGRMAFQDRMHLAVHPVRYLVDGGSVVFRTADGGEVYAAADRHSIMAFEIDNIDPASGHGWSVLASGEAEPVIDRYELDRVSQALPQAWESTDTAAAVRMRLEIIEGRRFVAPRSADSPPVSLSADGWPDRRG